MLNFESSPFALPTLIGYAFPLASSFLAGIAISPPGRRHRHLRGRPLGRRRAARRGFGRDHVHAVGLPQRVGGLGRERPADMGWVVGGRRPALLPAGTTAMGRV